MELIVDLHIHSHFSRATSKFMDIASLYRWGKIKGINIIGTGDFTHPKWFEELSEKLEEAEEGLYKLKDKYARDEDAKLPKFLQEKLIRFIPTVEISNIYKKNGQGRRVHNLIVTPSLKTAAKINTHLARIGNIASDGRPILGLDSKELLKITIGVDDQNLFIPAHIWTPWFAVFGSKSGFNSLEQAFEELTPHIYAIETGLSSDPFMNWRVKGLQDKTIVSNSDAHSAQKLGREANVINANLSYADIYQAIKTNDERFVGTIEFYPDEGKYHYDGHATCKVSFSPEETKKLKGVCPVCNRPLTVGVMYRVGELASEKEDFKPKNHKRVEYIVPLQEIIAECLETKVTAKKAVEGYEKVIFEMDDEFTLLRKTSLKDLEKAPIPRLGEAINRMREADIVIKPGYDGIFGIVKIFPQDEKERQQELF